MKKISFLTELSVLNVTKKFEFVVDSDASSHMINEKTLMTELTDQRELIKIAKKDQNISTIGVGQSVQVSNCNIKNVYYIPDFIET